MRALCRLAAVMVTCSSLDSRRCGASHISSVGSSDDDLWPKKLLSNFLGALQTVNEISVYSPPSDPDVNASPHKYQESDSLMAIEAAMAVARQKDAAEREFRNLVTVHIVVAEPPRFGLSEYFADAKRVLDRDVSPPGDHMPSFAGSCRSQAASGAQENHPQNACRTRSWLRRSAVTRSFLLCIYSYVFAYVLASW